MIEFLIERKMKKMKDEELVDFYAQNANNMSFHLKKKFVIESTKRELAKMGMDNCVVDIEDLPLGIDGMFVEEKNKISIGKSVLQNLSTTRVFYVIKHECTHAYQSKLEKEVPEDNHSVKLEYSRNRYHEDINFCNFHLTNNRMYVCNDVHISYESDQLTDIFYHLCISEREAFLAGYAREKEICKRNGLLYIEDNEVKQQIEKFKERYCCPNFTDEEVFDMVDLAYANLIEGTIPNNDNIGNLCANVMYDLSVVSACLSGNMNSQQAINYLTKTNKHCNLLNYNYTHVAVDKPTNSLCEKMNYYLENLSELENLNEVTQKDNPNLLALLCIYTNGEALKYIKDPENLFRQVANMSLTAIRFEEIFGDEFTKYVER